MFSPVMTSNQQNSLHKAREYKHQSLNKENQFRLAEATKVIENVDEEGSQ